MFLNRKGEKLFQPLFCLLATSVVWLLLMASSAWAGQTYVNLIMGDFNAKMAVDAIKAIRHSQPELVDEVHFQVVSGRTADKVLAEGTAGRLPPGAKGIALLNIMDSRMVANLMPYIQRMIRSGVRVYAVGGSYGTEQRELGLINDVIDHHPHPAPLGLQPFSHIIHDIGINVGQILNQQFRRIFRGKANFLAGQPFMGAMGADMGHGISLELMFQPEIEGDVLMVGCNGGVVVEFFDILLPAPRWLGGKKNISIS